MSALPEDGCVSKGGANALNFHPRPAEFLLGLKILDFSATLFSYLGVMATLKYGKCGIIRI